MLLNSVISWDIKAMHSGEAGSIAVSQPQGTRFYPELRLLRVGDFACSHLVCLVIWFPPTQKHASRSIAYTKLPLSVNEWCIEIDRRLIQCVFSAHAQFSRIGSGSTTSLTRIKHWLSQ